MKNIRAASVQFNHKPGGLEYNMNRVKHFVEQAAAQEVQLICFPEMCLTGYWHVRNLSHDEVDALAEPVPNGAMTQEVKALALKHKMTIGVGLIERAGDGQLYNTYVLAMSDGKIATHRKLHCFISGHMASGDQISVVDIPEGARVGMLICYDNNIIENARMNALKGADILLAPHQTGGCNTPSPRAMGTIDVALWQNRENDPAAIEAEFKGSKGRAWLLRWLPARAHDNGMFYIFSNGVGQDDDEVRTGNAMILDPYGEILAETWAAADTMVVTDLEAERLDMCTGRRWLRSRRPELYTPITIPTGIEEDTRAVRFETGTPPGTSPHTCDSLSGSQHLRINEKSC